MVRFATIGTSGVTERFLEALGQVEGAEYVAAYSRSLDKARSFGGPRGATLFFDDLGALAASDEVDAVYVASPNSLHAPQATQMARAGKHVLVEKAFASNEREARQVFEAAREAGVVAMEAMRNVHGPAWKEVVAALAEVGTPRLASVHFSKVTSRMARLRAGERVNVFDPHLSEGALMDIGVYAVEPVVALFGAPERVSGMAVTTRVPGAPEDDACATVDLAGKANLAYPGMVVDVAWGKVADDLLPCEVAGEEGTLVWEDVSCPRTLTVTKHADAGLTFKARTSGATTTRDLDVADNDMVYELADFVAATRGDAAALEAAASWEALTLGSLAVMDQIRQQVGVRFPADGE